MKKVVLQVRETNDGIPSLRHNLYSNRVQHRCRDECSGDSITLDAKGFGTLADASPVTGINHTCQTTTVLAIHSITCEETLMQMMAQSVTTEKRNV